MTQREVIENIVQALEGLDPLDLAEVHNLLCKQRVEYLPTRDEWIVLEDVGEDAILPRQPIRLRFDLNWPMPVEVNTIGFSKAVAKWIKQGMQGDELAKSCRGFVVNSDYYDPTN